MTTTYHLPGGRTLTRLPNAIDPVRGLIITPPRPRWWMVAVQWLLTLNEVPNHMKGKNHAL